MCLSGVPLRTRTTWNLAPPKRRRPRGTSGKRNSESCDLEEHTNTPWLHDRACAETAGGLVGGQLGECRVRQDQPALSWAMTATIHLTQAVQRGPASRHRPKVAKFDGPARFIQKPKSTPPWYCVGMSASCSDKLTGAGHRLEVGRNLALAEQRFWTSHLELIKFPDGILFCQTFHQHRHLADINSIKMTATSFPNSTPRRQRHPACSFSAQGMLPTTTRPIGLLALSRPR